MFNPDVNFYDCLDSSSAADFTSAKQTTMISSSNFSKGDKDGYSGL